MSSFAKNPKYPHHWDCKYILSGHPDEFVYCTSRSGNKRMFPDGSLFKMKKSRTDIYVVLPTGYVVVRKNTEK